VSAHLDRLMMTVALIDQVTKPLQGIQQTVAHTADAGRIGWEKMAGGTAGLVAAGFAVQSALMPAIEMDRVLGEVKSLGVMDEDLQTLQKTALSFSAEYGKSATEFVEASYDIQSAFAGINGDQLADITKSSAVLAAATKADTGTITSYMGTLYGIFKDQANNMGAGEWSKQVAGMTAQSVEMFKTTGKGMSDAFTGVGANATAAGIGMNEQMAILGTLQATMSGGQAGTQYKAFLSGVAGAQDKLGMSFTNSQGDMLPMLDILDKLNGKFGDTLDVGEGDALKKAFGSDEAVSMIKLLMSDTDGLASSINKLGGVTGMDKATLMAKAQTDQWQRLESSWFAIRAGVFGLVLPAISGIAGGMADGMTSILEWSQLFPHITAYLGYAALAIVGGAGALAAWNLAVGLSSLVMTAWASVAAVMGGIMGVLETVYIVLGCAMLDLNAIMLANPALWVVAGILALGAVIIGVVAYWDELIAALNEIWIFRQIGELFAAVGAVVSAWFSKLTLAWGLLINAFMDTQLVQSFMSLFGQITSIVSGYFSGLVSIARGAWQLMGAGISVLLLPFKVVFNILNAFFALLVDGPEAGMAVLATIPTLFTSVFSSASAGWSLICDGVLTALSYLGRAVLFLAQPFIYLGQQVIAVFQSMAAGWSWFVVMLQTTTVFQWLSNMFTLLTDGWNNFISWMGQLSVFDLLGSSIDWLIEKINLIPGIEIDSQVNTPALPSVAMGPLTSGVMPETPQIGLAEQQVKQRSERINQPISSYLQSTNTAQVPTQGYMPKMAKAMQGNGGKSMHTGDIHIKQEQPFTQAQLHEWDEMNTQ
jgi:TP901 family phage tail tape measure protein